MERYGIIEAKNKREIVLLMGSGCVYRKCRFCDYYSDSSVDENECFEANKSALDKVSGIYGRLEVINSGSVFELDCRTLEYIKKICRAKGISTIHFEAHYLYRGRIAALRDSFDGFDLKMKLGLESFDYEFRENVLKKGIDEKSPEVIGQCFDEANFLFGIKGQTCRTMLDDITLGLENFERICINIMNENSSEIKPDSEVITAFMNNIYPKIKDNERIDILISNTDFGVGD